MYTPVLYLQIAGVAVAAALCPIESAAVTLATEWPFGVIEGSYYVFLTCIHCVIMNDYILFVSYPSQLYNPFYLVPVKLSADYIYIMLMFLDVLLLFPIVKGP